ncbi:hypothetical protein JHK84_050256 [Glycine max]|nr:hypothetical protein JHK84_050256 [Glycine max]
MHHPAGRTTRRHSFVDHIIEVDIPLGWKPLNFERYDGTTTSLKGATLTWYGGLPPRSIDIFDTLIECFSVQYATNKSHCMTSATLSSLQQEDDESLRKFMDRFGPTAIQI